MGEYLINLFLYTFATYGILVLFRELILLLIGYKNCCKVVLIIENEDAEEILRDISLSLQDKKITEKVYVLNKNDNCKSNDIIEKYCTDNEFFIFTDKQKILEIINEEIK